MAVYVINNMNIHDAGEYKTYVRAFMPTLEGFGGKVLAVQNAPEPVEGRWPYDRIVLLEFPSHELARQWVDSPAYQAIAGHRRAGVDSNVVMLDGLS
ncbi:DUF1330 domain-containing protein [Roseateles sp. BYS78W]|uniref:DUF1330 domain-containing protein n=1 Tax=Pelomonas candidula TaxID=3299025 RepID=A0ABW7HEF5_9BURK